VQHGGGDAGEPQEAERALALPIPAPMFTARLQAAMTRLATMTTSVMSSTMARSRAVDGSSASTTTASPWAGNATSSEVRARSIAPGVPSVATTTAATGSLAIWGTDRWADGHSVVDACELAPRMLVRK
jgi:hypothetical protein